MGVFVCRELNNLHPEKSHIPFQKLEIAHLHGTRSVTNENLFLPRGNSQVFHKTISYSGGRLWNKIPVGIRMAQTIESFKSQYEFYLAAQQAQCL